MSGMVGIIANDAARYTLFSVSLSRLKIPVNTSVQWALGSDRIVGRNNLVRASLEAGSEWLWFLDDDHAFPPGILARLLSHEQPVVAALYMQRMTPFAPVAYGEKLDDGGYVPIMLHDHEPDDLVPIVAAGTGGMLIRSEVFREVEEPWFEHGRASEDLIFCDKAVAAGFPIYCDLGAHLGHISSSVVWPGRVDDEWVVGFSVADQVTLSVPIEKPEPARPRLVLPRR